MEEAESRPKKTAQVDLDPAKLFPWLVKTLGIPPAFFNRLRSDDDWTLVIKLHAMIEAGLNHMLVLRFLEPELADVVARLDTSNFKTGKLAFLRGFGLLPDQLLKFIQKLSELRNSCVHDVKNFTFDLKEYFSKFDKKQSQQWAEFFTLGLPETFRTPEGEELNLRDECFRNPRFALLNTTLRIMHRAHECEKALESEIDQDELRQILGLSIPKESEPQGPTPDHQG